MILKKIALLIVLMLTINSNIAQEKEVPNVSNNYLTFDLLQPTFSYAPRWTIGYYRRFSEKIVLGLDFGMGDKATSIGLATEGPSIEDNYFSIEISPEIQYFLKSNRKAKYFIGLDLSYIYHKDTFTNSYFGEDPNNVTRFDSADYERIKYAMTFNYGVIFPISDHLGFVTKVGAGIRNSEVSFTNIQNPRSDVVEESLLSFISDYRRAAGNDLGIALSLDLKFVYRW